MSGCCIKWIAGIALLAFLVIGLPLIIYYHIVHPKDPTFTVDHPYVTGFNLMSDGHLTSFFDIGLKADNNRNHKLKLVYRNIRVSIFKDKQNLGTYSFPGFTQPKRNVTVLRVHPESQNVHLKKGPTSDFGVESGMGYINFDVFMTARMNRQNLEVNCKGVNATVDVRNAHSTSIITQNFPSCHVHLYTCTDRTQLGINKCGYY